MDIVRSRLMKEHCIKESMTSGVETIKEQVQSSRLGNDAHADDVDIRPIYDEVRMAEVQTTAEINIFAIGQQHTEQPEFNNEGERKAKKKTQESSRNSEPSVMPSARPQSITNGSKPKPRINNQKSKNWPASKSSCICVLDANHDIYVTIFGNEVNSHALRLPSNKTTKRYIPVEQTSFAKKPERQIPKGHRFSIKKTSVVHEKTMTPRSCLRWKPTGKIFKTVGLRWVPTGKIFTSSTTKVDSEPTNGLNDDITNQYECKQTLDVSAGTLNIHAGTSLNPIKEGLRVCSELGIHDHSNELSSSKLVPKVVPPADKTATSRQELELLFHTNHITMLRIHKDGDGDALFQLKTDSLPHAHAQTTKTYYKHQDSRIMKAQELKTKTYAQTLIYKIFLQRYQVYQGRLLGDKLSR
ncbi:hypothetical protein Tco_0610796 [Tanacetum coccineum]